jgi:hypothetical protein
MPALRFTRQSTRWARLLPIALFLPTAGAWAQLPDALPGSPVGPASSHAGSPDSPSPDTATGPPDTVTIRIAPAVGFDLADKAGFYANRLLSFETILGPATEAATVMAVPPKGYPKEWRQGASAFGRNFGAVFGRAQTAEFSRFAVGVALREDPRYYSSTGRSIVARFAHAIGFTLIDRSDSGNDRLAFANLIGATAGGFVGNAYLPGNYTDLSHVGVRIGVQMGGFAGINLFQEFTPEFDRLTRALTSRFRRGN